jgi:hypothetical protein
MKKRKERKRSKGRGGIEVFICRGVGASS